MIIIAHRGMTKNAPENSLAAIKAALDADVDGVEFDVRRSKDGVIYLLHDKRLRRTTTHKGRLSRKHKHELVDCRLDNDECLPTLDSALRLIAGHKSHKLIFLEIKEPGFEKEILMMLGRYRLTARTVICSFDKKVLADVKKLEPSMKLEYECNLILDKDIRIAKHMGCYSISSLAYLVRKKHVKALKECGIKLIPFMIRRESTKKKMVSLGVDGMCVDL